MITTTYEIQKHYKSNLAIRKAIMANYTYMMDKELKVHCYTSTDGNRISTDLEIDIYTVEGRYIESYTIYSIESEYEQSNFNEIMDEHREALRESKKKLYNYLLDHFYSVEHAEDYAQ